MKQCYFLVVSLFFGYTAQSMKIQPELLFTKDAVGEIRFSPVAPLAFCWKIQGRNGIKGKSKKIDVISEEAKGDYACDGLIRYNKNGLIQALYMKGQKTYIATPSIPHSKIDEFNFKSDWIAFNPDGNLLASSNGLTLSLINRHTKKIIATLQEDEMQIVPLCFDRKQTYLYLVFHELRNAVYSAPKEELIRYNIQTQEQITLSEKKFQKERFANCSNLSDDYLVKKEKNNLSIQRKGFSKKKCYLKLPKSFNKDDVLASLHCCNLGKYLIFTDQKPNTIYYYLYELPKEVYTSTFPIQNKFIDISFKFKGW